MFPTEKIVALSTSHVTANDMQLMETFGEMSPTGVPRFINQRYGVFIPLNCSSHSELRRVGFSPAFRVLLRNAEEHTDATFLFLDSWNYTLDGDYPTFSR